MILTLRRLASSPKGTPGVLMHNFFPLVTTLEPMEIIIPCGSYLCKLVPSPPHIAKINRSTLDWVVDDVKGHVGIFFHIGNTVRDTQGCILVGGEFCYGSYSIANSRAALTELKRFLEPSREFSLVVL